MQKEYHLVKNNPWKNITKLKEVQKLIGIEKGILKKCFSEYKKNIIYTLDKTNLPLEVIRLICEYLPSDNKLHYFHHVDEENFENMTKRQDLNELTRNNIFKNVNRYGNFVRLKSDLKYNHIFEYNFHAERVEYWKRWDVFNSRVSNKIYQTPDEVIKMFKEIKFRNKNNLNLIFINIYNKIKENGLILQSNSIEKEEYINDFIALYSVHIERVFNGKPYSEALGKSDAEEFIIQYNADYIKDLIFNWYIVESENNFLIQTEDGKFIIFTDSYSMSGYNHILAIYSFLKKIGVYNIKPLVPITYNKKNNVSKNLIDGRHLKGRFIIGFILYPL